jgi:signal transduction histidine kinase
MAMRSSLVSSIASRLALMYGLIAVVSVAAAVLAFFFGTIGVLESSTDSKIQSISERLKNSGEEKGMEALRREILLQLDDWMDTDTEIFLLQSPDGRALLGNVSGFPVHSRDGMLQNGMLKRDRGPFRARFITQRLSGGARLLVGRDRRELDALQSVVNRAVIIGSLVALLFVSAGTWFLRRSIDRRVGAVRRIACRVSAGDLAQRVPESGEDEFSLLSRDINRMLAQIERLMDGVRNVSNAIAHDLRTPLSRVRNRLVVSLQSASSASSAPLVTAAGKSIEDIDQLIILFEKLMRIAAAESGVRPVYPEKISLGKIATGIVELYEAAAEESTIRLQSEVQEVAAIPGDRDLVAAALGGLLDNALKYAGAGSTVTVRCRPVKEGVELLVWDTGPGVPEEVLPLLTERFFRVDRSRHLPGNGIGLSNISAIMKLHGGTLDVRNRHPGLEVRLVFTGAADSGGRD